MWYVSANRDEDVFARSNDFLIDRENARDHLAFGQGVHFCMGSRIAEMQLRVLWEEVLRRFRHVEVVGPPLLSGDDGTYGLVQAEWGDWMVKMHVPEGFVRRLYAPYEPSTDDAKVEVVDFSNLILSDNAALLAASYLLPHKTTDIPTGAVFDAHPAFAKNSVSPGNNVDPTSSYAQTAVGGASGTLTSFSYTTASGWAGSQSASDPSCLVFDGLNDYVTWGDLAECDFGVGSFTVAVWFKLSALNVLQTIVGKRGASTAYTGWSFTVSTSNHLIGLVSESIATNHYAKITHAYPMVIDLWYHAVLTWDNTTTFDAHLYVNGTENNLEEIQMSHAFATGISNTAALKIGDH
jgi:hypothetical protein